MKHTLRSGILLAILAAATIPLRASSPAVNGFVSGIELCPQSICQVAVFVGFYQGQFGVRPNAFGTVSVAVKHDDLPTVPGQCSDITSGLLSLQVGFRPVTGGTVGSLCLNAIPANTFTVNVDVALNSPASGSIHFTGLLDHRVFPPLISGILVEQP